jgi:hypothetical protein
MEQDKLLLEEQQQHQVKPPGPNLDQSEHQVNPPDHHVEQSEEYPEDGGRGQHLPGDFQQQHQMKPPNQHLDPADSQNKQVSLRYKGLLLSHVLFSDLSTSRRET